MICLLNFEKLTSIETGLILTILSHGLHEHEKSEGHAEVAQPVDGRGDRVAGAPSPQRVDLGVDGPWHAAHTWNTRGNIDGGQEILA